LNVTTETEKTALGINPSGRGYTLILSEGVGRGRRIARYVNDAKKIMVE